MASTIPAARTWLVAALAADPGLDGVVVARTGLWDDIPQLERIEVRNASSISRERRAMGGAITETYAIPVYIEAVSHGLDLEATENRLWALVAAVERVVEDDHTFGGLLVSALPAGAPDGEESGSASDGRFAARITLSIDCQAVVRLGT